jgi:hypothetical protein
MDTDLHTYTARLRIDPHYDRHLPDSDPAVDRVVVAGYHAAFAVVPCPTTVVGVFPGLDLVAARTEQVAVMALVRVEHASQVVTPNADGSSRIHWETNTFGRLPTGMSWYLAPTALDPDGRCVIADGRWCPGGRQAVLPRSVTVHAPGALFISSAEEE